MIASAVHRTGPAGPAAAAETAAPLRVLVMTKIFPNRERPQWAPFNRQQFAALARLPGVAIVDVLATIPWFPGVGLLGARSLAAGLVRVPGADVIAGLPVRHPRTVYVPRIGHALSGGLYAASLLPHVLRYRGRVDVLLAAWAYPDGCAGVALSRLLGVPCVVKLHGSDINVLSQRWGPRHIMKTLLPRAARIVAVSATLRERALELGARPERVDVVRNGVDGALFYPRERGAARRALGLPEAAPIALCVSRMERDKGVLDLLQAFAGVRRALPAARLVLLGGGAALDACRERAAQPDLAGAVELPGAVPLEQVPGWLAAANLAVMPSWAEGLPNTVLEAHACGRPVVATDVGGVHEVMTAPELGVLVPPRQPEALAQAMLQVLSAPAPAERIVASRGSGTWQESAAALLHSLRKAVGGETHE